VCQGKSKSSASETVALRWQNHSYFLRPAAKQQPQHYIPIPIESLNVKRFGVMTSPKVLD
ncbi:MAG: hypothetical protein M3X11_21190, partial [Acidobacteriota bacterium]|nr:hypothetical protein [Acidobacteriota bacterium]